MTLAELRKQRPTMFYPQDWFDGEAFMDQEPGLTLSMPTSVGAESNGLIVSAIDLAVLFLKSSSMPIWRGFLWTTDCDDLGQRIYVGGIGQAKKSGFQIHRHLEVNTEQWGWPIW